MRFELHSEAREEFLNAVSRYEAEVPGLGARFVAEFERCVGLLLDAPQIGSPLGRKLRRFVLDDNFPFSVVYAVIGDTFFGRLLTRRGGRVIGSSDLPANYALERTVIRQRRARRAAQSER